MHDTFIYLRTKQTVEEDFETLRSLANGFPYAVGRSLLTTETHHANDAFVIPMLFLGKDETTWENGFIIRLPTYRELDDIIPWLEPAVSEFDSWAIYQRNHAFRESSNSTLFGQFFWFAGKTSISQIFVRSDEPDYKIFSIVEEIRSTLRKACDYVFNFKDGKVLLLSTEEPATITARRCASALGKLDAWVIVDTTGYTHSDPNSSNVWAETSLDTFAGFDDGSE